MVGAMGPTNDEGDGRLVKVVETRREAFLRLAEKRTNSVLERIRILSNCSNPYAYEYEDEDVKEIFVAIEKELRIARARFQNQRRREFRLAKVGPG
jgi:hypothetical protein